MYKIYILVDQFPRPVKTEYHKLGELKQWKLVPHTLSYKSELGCEQGHGPSDICRGFRCP